MHLLFALLLLQPQPIVQDPMIDIGRRLRHLSTATILYTRKHQGALPPDLLSTIPYLSTSPEDEPQAPRDVFLTAHAASAMPPGADNTWLKDHASFTYLAYPDINLEDIPDPSHIVLAHLNFNEAIPWASDEGPDETGVALAFADGGLCFTSSTNARRDIESSTAILTALHTGGPLPPSAAALFDTRAIMQAISAYAAAHEGLLPPDLGATFPFVPSTSKRLATPVQRASIYLTPHQRENTHTPEDPTPDWINQHAGYLYVANSTLPATTLDHIPQTSVLYSRPDSDEFTTREGVPAILLASLLIPSEFKPKEYARWEIARSHKYVDALGGKGALPDDLNALIDMRVIWHSMKQYAAAHGDHLPAALGDILPYLPNEHSPRIVGVGLTMGPANLARAFLSPADEKTTTLPETLTPEWINQHCSYLYNGRPTETFNYLRHTEHTSVIFYGKPTEVYTVPDDRDPALSIKNPTRRIRPFTTSHWGPWLEMPESVERDMQESVADRVAKPPR